VACAASPRIVKAAESWDQVGSRPGRMQSRHL
jgi:hypothetical protein